MNDPTPIDVRHLGREQVICCWRVDDALIDPGPAVSLPNLIEALDGWEPKRLLLTHIHLDHAGGAGVLARRWPQLEIYVHERGAPHVIDPSKLVASATRLYGEDMDRLWGEIPPIAAERVHVLRGGETIDGFEVAYTPGHAQHHVAYRHSTSGWVFTGDVAACRIEGHQMLIPPTPPPDIDLELWRQSLATLRAWQPTALGLTHFGAVHDPVEHLDRLERALETWGELGRRLDAEDFLAAVTAATAAALPQDVRVALHQAMPPETLWAGLDRYWRKRAEREGDADR